GNNALKEWEQLVLRLAEYIRPNHLVLYLIVNVHDVETAEAVLKPLDQLPTLKNCGLWLNNDPIPDINTLVRATVKRLKSPRTPDEPFNFLGLPIELRLRILEYSDLIYDSVLEW
ncbi:hypothetical protein BU23DRAFT_377839, partial [Bimuria novae-zelandiae CBS 107.79]